MAFRGGNRAGHALLMQAIYEDHMEAGLIRHIFSAKLAGIVAQILSFTIGNLLFIYRSLTLNLFLEAAGP